MTVKRKNPPIEVEESEEQNMPLLTEEGIYLVKLDSKRFESRNMEQVIQLIRGSEGVVSKITIERQ